MITINSAILHILDFNSGLAVYSRQPLDMSDAVNQTYIDRHIEKVLSDERLKCGELLSNSTFKENLEKYKKNEIDLVSISSDIAKTMFDAISVSDKLTSVDVVVCDFNADEQHMLAILMYPNKTYYTHQIVQLDIGFKNELIQHCAILPSLSQKLDEFAFIDIDSGKVKFFDKKRNIDGHNSFIFKDHVLKCTSEISAKETIKIVTKIADKIAEDNGENSAVAVSRVKSFIAETAEVSENIKPAELIQEVFAESPIMQTEFEKEIKEVGIPEQIKIEKSVAIKSTRNHKIKTDTGIEIIFPSDYLDNNEYINIINNPDGTISIELNKIGKIMNKI
ncbi:MAG: nucleoid-associated protein [Acutalibacteraceae bacterium]